MLLCPVLVRFPPALDLDRLDRDLEQRWSTMTNPPMSADEFRRIAADVCTPEQLAVLNAPVERPDPQTESAARLGDLQIAAWIVVALLLLILWRVW